jgi:hypothetical protein
MNTKKAKRITNLLLEYVYTRACITAGFEDKLFGIWCENFDKLTEYPTFHHRIRRFRYHTKGQWMDYLHSIERRIKSCQNKMNGRKTIPFFDLDSQSIRFQKNP